MKNRVKTTAVYASVDIRGIDDMDTEAAMTAYRCTSDDCGKGTVALSAEEEADDYRHCIHCGAQADPVKDATEMNSAKRLMTATEEELVSILCPKCDHKSVSERSSLHRNHKEGDKIRIHCTECGTPLSVKASLIPLPGETADDGSDEEEQPSGNAKAGIFGQGDDVNVEFDDDDEETSASGDEDEEAGDEDEDAGDEAEASADTEEADEEEDADTDEDDGSEETSADAEEAEDEDDFEEDEDEEYEDDMDAEDEVEASADEGEDADTEEADDEDDSEEETSADAEDGDDEEDAGDEGNEEDAGDEGNEADAGAGKNRKRRRQARQMMDDMDGDEGIDDEDMEYEDEEESTKGKGGKGKTRGKRKPANAGEDETAMGDGEKPMNYIHMGDGAAEISFSDADEGVLSRINRVMARFPRLRVTKQPRVRAGSIKMAVSGRKAKACMDAMRREFGNIFDYATLETEESEAETEETKQDGEDANANEESTDTANSDGTGGEEADAEDSEEEAKPDAEEEAKPDAEEEAKPDAEPEHVADLPAIALVDEEVDVSFAHDGETLFCMAGTTCIAALEIEGETEQLQQTVFDEAEKSGLRPALEGAGFEMVSARVDAGKAVKAEQERQAEEADAAKEAAAAETAKDLRQSLEIAVMGVNRGVLDTDNPLATNIVDALVTAGVERAEATEAIAEAFDESADEYAAILVEQAMEMLGKPEEVRNSLATTMAKLTHKAASTAGTKKGKPETASGDDVKDRLANPMKRTARETASGGDKDDEEKPKSKVAEWAASSPLGDTGQSNIVDINSLRNLGGRRR